MTRNSVLASVIIVTHNQADILRLQLASLEQQSDVAQLEVIVTDDSSSDSEFIKIQQLVNTTALRCKLISQKVDRYRAPQARNSGIKVASGNILILLDGDMVPETDVVRLHLALHATNKNLLVGGQRIRRVVPSGTTTYGDAIEICRDLTNTTAQLRKWQSAEEQKRTEYISSQSPWRAVLGCHLSVPRSPEVLFDENFVGWGPDDWEFTYRLTRVHGYRPVYAPNIKAYEIDALGGGASNVFRFPTQQAVIDYMRNTLYFLDRCSELSVEDICWGLRRIRFVSGQWVISKNRAPNLNVHIQKMREWLAINT